MMEYSYKKTIQFFSALSDETRLKILLSLKEKPRTVNEIHRSLDKKKITLSAISHQLKYLTGLDIIVYEKRGKEKIFKLSDNFCWCILKDVLNHFKEETKV